MILAVLTVPLSTVSAQPYGVGKYNEAIPYGAQTSLSITATDVTIPVTPVSSGALATGSSAVTVVSTDVKGFKLYIRSLSTTNMDNLGVILPASLNATPLPLAINTWGYNTDSSSSFAGMTLSDTLIKSVTIPAAAGDLTTVSYGVYLDLLKPAGNYVTTVMYTAVPQTD